MDLFLLFFGRFGKRIGGIKNARFLLTEKESEQLGNSNIAHTVNLSIYISIRTNISEHS